MNSETIVAVYDNKTDATEAVSELESAGIPSSAISEHAKNGMTYDSGTTAAPAHKRTFWEKLFGLHPETEYDTTVYDRSVESGATVVSVQAEERYVQKTMDILERHHPVDLDERGAAYGLAASPLTAAAPAVNTTSTAPIAGGVTTGAATAATGGLEKEQSMPLAEETLVVGKRAVNRGTTRVRRYVVETPVEEQVNLRSESVEVERRPVSGDRPVADADFSDKVVEVAETAEEPVISKQARVKEEVVIHKEATDRTENVRDNVRREEVEVTKEPGSGSGKASWTRPSDAADPDAPKHS